MENRNAAFEECGLCSLLMLNVLKNVRVTGDMCLCGNYTLCLNSPPDICGLEAKCPPANKFFTSNWLVIAFPRTQHCCPVECRTNDILIGRRMQNSWMADAHFKTADGQISVAWSQELSLEFMTGEI